MWVPYQACHNFFYCRRTCKLHISRSEFKRTVDTKIPPKNLFYMKPFVVSHHKRHPYKDEVKQGKGCNYI